MQDATSLAEAIASGRVSAVEVMAATLEAIEARASLGAVAVLNPEYAMASARGTHRGVFGGVPFLGKDLGSASAEFPSCAGVDALRRRSLKGGRDSALFARFKSAGLVQAGLSTVPPFGLALTSDPARNPFDTVFSPGGSSGGAAAAVAGGIVAIAHATDAAGSIRVPSACCGLFGLKPSRGAMIAGPDFGNYLMGLAEEFVIARSLRDVVTAFGFCCKEKIDVRGSDLASPARIALCIPSRCNTEQASAARKAAEGLHEIGCAIEICAAPDELGVRAAAITRTILTASLAEWMDALGIRDDELPTFAAAVASEGRAMTAARLFAASRDMVMTGDQLWTEFAAFDVILTPILSAGPPMIGAFDFAASDPSQHFATMDAIAPNAALANVTGSPALAMPYGTDERGLPIGIQLMSRPGTDPALLALASRLCEVSPRIDFPYSIAGHP